MNTQRIKHDNLPISREFKIQQFERELEYMLSLLAVFHDELLDDKRDAVIIYSRVWLGTAHEGAKTALQALKGLQQGLKEADTGLTELAEKANKP